MNAPDERTILRQKAQEQLQTKHWLEAEESFKQLLEIDAQDEEALEGRSEVLDSLGQFGRLYETAQLLLTTNPASAPALAFKARALQKLERISEATIANDQALLLDTNLPLAWINRCGLQLLQQKYPEALRSSLRATELAPNDARAWANKGMALYNNNAIFEALEAFNTSLEKEPDFLLALQMRGEIFLRLGRIEVVLTNAQQLLTLHPSDLTGLTQAIRAHRSWVTPDRARQHLQPSAITAPRALGASSGLGSSAAVYVDLVSEIDPLGSDFIYIQVANAIAARIEVGEITHKLPAERDLAEQYGVAYQTVRHSMQILRDRGLIITRQGRGTFVAPAARREEPGSAGPATGAPPS